MELRDSRIHGFKSSSVDWESRDRILQGIVEQMLDVLVPEMVKQLVEAPKNVPQDRIQQRTAEGIADIPVPQVVKELVKVFRVSPRTGLNIGSWCWVQSCRPHRSLSGSWGSPLAVSSTLAACGAAGPLICFSLRLYDNPHHPSLRCVWIFFFISSIIVHVLEA